MTRDVEFDTEYARPQCPWPSRWPVQPRQEAPGGGMVSSHGRQTLSLYTSRVAVINCIPSVSRAGCRPACRAGRQ